VAPGAPGARGVPRVATGFIGGAAELEAGAAAAASRSLVTLAGPAGAGKTRLAAEVARHASRTLGVRVRWADLDAVRPGRVAATVARALRVPDVPGRSAVDLVVARLGEASTLLVLDNCEHVLDETARFVERLLDGAPPPRVLATSREPLHVAGEDVHRLAGLGVPEPAARLFLERAGPGQVRDHDVVGVAEVVGRLDGLPLAIELAAARLDALSVPELARSLRERLSLLGDGSRAAPARRRTLETAIAWSHDLVSPVEQRVLRRVSVFPAGFDAEAAEAVAAGEGVTPATVLPALARLAETSLLVVDRSANVTSYRLLFTIRMFARERLCSSGEQEATARRHRDVYLRLAQMIAPAMIGAGLAAGLERARPEHENFHAALRWSLERGEHQAAFHLAAYLSVYWFRIGFIADGGRLLREALAHADEDDPVRPLALLGRSTLSHSAAAPEMVEHADEAVAACEAGDDPELLALALAWRARALLDRGHLREARIDLARAGELGASVGSDEAIGFADQVRACVALAAGDLDEAGTLAARACDRFRRLRAPLDAGYALVDLARVRLAQDRTREALEVAGAAVTDFRHREDPRGLAASLVCVGHAYRQLGDLERARPMLDEALALSRRWGFASLAEEVASALPERRSAPVMVSRGRRQVRREEPAL
jgi:predicted ATPase